jgi:hypothetical protein
LRELRKKLAAKIHSRAHGGSTRKRRQKSSTIDHLASSRQKLRDSTALLRRSNGSARIACPPFRAGLLYLPQNERT